MKSDQYANGFLSPQTQDIAFRLIELPFASFTGLVRIAKLDPTRDFQHADLTSVDFSQSDLTGFDFSGADLRGATGINVTWDESTSFTGADLDGSVFKVPITLGRLFDGDKRAKDLLKRVNRFDTSQKIIWCADHLKRGAHFNDLALPVAKQIFLSSDDAFLRSQLMFFMTSKLDDESLKDLLIASMSAHHSSGAVITNAFDIAVRRGFLKVRAIRATACALLLSSHALVREKAMSFLMRSKPSAVELSAIHNAIQTHYALSATYVIEAARSFGEEYKVVVRHPVTNEVLTPGKVIDGEGLYLIARRWLRMEVNVEEARKGIPLSERHPASVFFAEPEVRERMKKVVELHQHLRVFGITFKYDPNLPNQVIHGLPKEQRSGKWGGAVRAP